MSSKEDKGFSLVICSTLDNLGFKKENVSLRSKYTLEIESVANLGMEKLSPGADFTVIHAGSFSEGLQLSDSDSDYMIACNDAVCLDHGDFNENNFEIFATDYTNTAPGYTKLVHVREISNKNARSLTTFLFTLCRDSFVTFPYISSKVVKKNVFQLNSVYNDIVRFEGIHPCLTTNGPAMTTTCVIGNQICETDCAFSIYFYGDKHLHRWATRTRNYTWPSKDIIKEISEMEGYIVPVGDKESENQDLEWRICFTTAEKKLVSYLNDTQTKLYVLLKLLSKHVLKPVCKALTSYVVKNVVFWITETTPQEVFSPDNLLHLVLKSLHFIKYCFENNHFPNYMIPERNIFRGAVCGPEKKSIIKLLSECLKEGRHVILRIPKLYDCMSLTANHPAIMVTYRKWRDEIETHHFNIIREGVTEVYSNHITLNPEYWREKAIRPNVTEAQLKFIFTMFPPAECISMARKGKSVIDIAVIYEKRMKLMSVL